MEISLLQTDIINIQNWKKDETYEGSFPQGARDKYAVFSEENSFFKSKSGSQFMFKSSWRSKNKDDEVKDQYWVEIIAYYIGCLLEIKVPKLI